MMNRIALIVTAACLLAIGNQAVAQKKAERYSVTEREKGISEAADRVNYGIVSPDEIKKDMKCVLEYLERNTPYEVIDGKKGRHVPAGAELNREAQLERGTFSLVDNGCGMTYSAMFTAAELLGDDAYRDYAHNRLSFLAEVLPAFGRVYEKYGVTDSEVIQLLSPRDLDDCGTMCAAMIKACLAEEISGACPLVEGWVNTVMYKTTRLADGTFSRDCPFRHTLWMDDIYKGVPALALMGALSKYNQTKYYREALFQIGNFADRLFVSEKGLFRHGWVEDMRTHPAYYWGPANGMAMLALCEVLDALPSNYEGRNGLIELLRKHIEGVAACQSKDGFWYRLLDRCDSGYETSSTAFFVYAIARAINRGWVDAIAYGPVALLGWQALSSAIGNDGRLSGVSSSACVAYDPAYYVRRPMAGNVLQGYGAVIGAGAEMCKLLESNCLKMNGGAVCLYPTLQQSDASIFTYSEPGNFLQFVAGVSRLNSKAPVVFVIGDSTVKYRSDKGEADRWGWGGFLQDYFDSSRITVENCAVEGRSSRTYITEGLWDRLLPALRKGDYLIIDFGHNDNNPLNTGLARGTLPGIGHESKKMVIERDGSMEEIFTYGHYMRIYIRQARAKGVEVILLSHTPANQWENGKMKRCAQTYRKWTKELAEQEMVHFVDLNDLTAGKFDLIGQENAKIYYKDLVHTSKEGAVMNAESVIEGISRLDECNLKKFLDSYYMSNLKVLSNE